MLLDEPSRFCPSSHLSSSINHFPALENDLMRKLIFACVCSLVLTHPTAILSQVQSPTANGVKPVNHGGKIETKYDGFNYETVLRLKKMKVTCDGFKDKFKDACVSVEISLHCPGTQLNYVKQVKLQVFFENKDWVHLHPPDQRELSVVIDSGTLHLGRMQPASNAAPGRGTQKSRLSKRRFPTPRSRRSRRRSQCRCRLGRACLSCVRRTGWR